MSSFFSFPIYYLGVIAQKPLPTSEVVKIHLFSSKSYIGFALKFRQMIHLEVIFTFCAVGHPKSCIYMYVRPSITCQRDYSLFFNSVYLNWNKILPIFLTCPPPPPAASGNHQSVLCLYELWCVYVCVCVYIYNKYIYILYNKYMYYI